MGISTTTPEEKRFRKRLKDLHALGTSWRDIAEMPEFLLPNDKRIPAGTLCTIAKGKRKMPNKYKVHFGIPFETPAKVCLIHGIVHKYDCRTQTVKGKARKPQYKSLFDWPVNELRIALLNREDVK